jgi:hypothetical protein
MSRRNGRGKYIKIITQSPLNGFVIMLPSTRSVSEKMLVKGD